MGGAHRLSPAAAETPGTRLLSARENSLASGASSGYGAAFASLKPSLPPPLPAAAAPDVARQGSDAFPRMRLSPKLRAAPPPPAQRVSPSSSGFRSGPPAPLVGLGKSRPAAPRPRVSPLLAPSTAPRASAPAPAPLATTTNVVTHHHHHHYGPAPAAAPGGAAPHVCSTEAVFADQATAARGLRSPPRGTKTPAATRALYTPREERPVPRGGGGGGGGGAVEWVSCPETVAALQRMGVRDGGVDDPARLALRSMQPVWNGQVAVGLDYGGGAADDARRTPYVLPAAEAQPPPPPSGPVQVVDYSEDLSPMPAYSQGYGAAAAVPPHSPYLEGEGGNPTAVEVVKQLFYLRGIDDSHHSVMSPWTDNPPLLDDVLKLVTKKVPVTRFGLRTPPETRLFTIVSFRDNEKRMVPWLVWLEQDAQTGELQMRDRCPLDALVSFKAGKWCQESPGFAPYLKAAPGGGERAIIVREDAQQALASDTRGCMVLEFTKRLVEVHCDHREDWRSLVNVFRNVVKINTAAQRYAKVLQQGGPPSPYGLGDPSAQQPYYGSEQQGLQRVDTVPKAGRI